MRTPAAAAALVVALALPAGAAAQQSLTGIDIAVTAGQAFNRAVATLEEPGLGPDSLVATIDWGDGTPATGGTIAQVGRTTYQVSGAHTYAAPGTRTMRISVRYPDGGALRTVATATVNAPPPPSPPPPTARLTLAKPAVARGELVVLDASGTTGPAQGYAFDLNGNGTFETTCGTPYAGAVLSTAGSRELAVRAIGLGGPGAIGRATAIVTGTRQAPPKGQGPLKAGTAIGGCLAHEPGTAADLAAAFEQAFTCPHTVQVGVAEATIPQEKHFPPLAGDPCFKRESAPPSQPSAPSLKLPGYPRFVAQQEIVHVNGIEIDTRPNPNAGNNNLIISEPTRTIRPKNPGWQPVEMRVRRDGVGALRTEQVKMGTWYVDKPGVVGTFPIEDFFDPQVLGMSVVSKESPITFTANREARLKVFVVPPFSFLGKSTPTGKPLDLLTDNTDGLRVEGGSVVTGGGGGTYELDMALGVFRLTGTLAYTNEGGSSVWQGDVKLEIPDSPVDHITGFIRFRDGKLEYATVSAPFAGSGIGPLFAPVPVYLVELGGTLTPHSIQADATFAAGPKLFGDFRAATAKADMSILFSPFVLAFTADELKIMHWPVKANAKVVVMKSQFLADAFWGPIDFGPITNFRVNVLAKIGQPWVIAGGGTACFEVFIPVGCVAVNAAGGPKGITGCAGVEIAGEEIAGGIRIPWNPAKFWNWSSYWGCSFQLVQAKVSAARAAAIRAGARAAAYPVRVPRGLRAGLFVIRGSGAQPQVVLRGPDGTQITTPPAGQDHVRGARWLAIRDTNDASVHVVVARPAAGRWQVSELDGSPAVSSVHFAEPLPRRFARARVTGRGRTRTLRYRVARARGVQVRFVERGGDLDDPEQVVEQPIGRATRASGSIRFTVADAKLRRRRIDAVVESQGSVIETETIARFTAPRFRLPPPRVSVRRSRGRLLVRWRPVAGAGGYQVLVDRSDGPTSLGSRPARARTLRVGGISGVTAATVEVRAVSPAGYIGRPGVARAERPATLAVPRRLRAARVLRRGFSARCTAAGEGRCVVTVETGRRTLAAGARRLGYGQTGRVAVRPTPAGRRALRKALRSGRALAADVVPSIPGAGVRSRRVTFR